MNTEPTGTYCGVCGYVHLEGSEHGPQKPVSAHKAFLKYVIEIIDRADLAPVFKLDRIREMAAQRYRECQ